MSRNFGVMSGRSALGGTSDRPSAGGAKQYNRAGSNVIQLVRLRPPGMADLNSEPLQSAPLFLSPPRGEFAQAMVDILTVSVWALLGLLAVAIVGGLSLALGWWIFFH